MRYRNTPVNAPKTKIHLFAFFNFGIANLMRFFELTKFKNENFEICNYISQKTTEFNTSQKQTISFKVKH